MQTDETLIVGWPSIARECGRSPQSLRQAHSDGMLPVTPIKRGHRVAMTPAMIQELVAQPKTKAPAA